MKQSDAVARLSALAQENRLAIFRLLVGSGPAGLPAGEISTRLQLPAPTLSFHLKEMSHAGLLQSRQEGRYIYYAPDFEAMNDLLSFLMQNCCADTGESCGPACTPKEKKS